MWKEYSFLRYTCRRRRSALSSMGGEYGRLAPRGLPGNPYGANRDEDWAVVWVGALRGGWLGRTG